MRLWRAGRHVFEGREQVVIAFLELWLLVGIITVNYVRVDLSCLPGK